MILFHRCCRCRCCCSESKQKWIKSHSHRAFNMPIVRSFHIFIQPHLYTKNAPNIRTDLQITHTKLKALIQCRVLKKKKNTPKHLKEEEENTARIWNLFQYQPDQWPKKHTERNIPASRLLCCSRLENCFMRNYRSAAYVFGGFYRNLLVLRCVCGCVR